MVVMEDDEDLYHFIIATQESTACVDFEVTTPEGLDEFYRDYLEHDPDPFNGNMWDGIEIIQIMARCEAKAKYYGQAEAWNAGINPIGTTTCVLRPVLKTKTKLYNSVN